jgi:hypothetical protein
MSAFAIDDARLRLLAKAAWIDFVHDFNDSTRAKVTRGMLNDDPFGPVKGNKIAGIDKLLYGAGGDTAFHVFKRMLSELRFGDATPFQTVLTESGTPSGILHETDILADAGVPYKDAISALPNTIDPD